jgi:hypothetical protein
MILHAFGQVSAVRSRGWVPDRNSFDDFRSQERRNASLSIPTILEAQTETHMKTGREAVKAGLAEISQRRDACVPLGSSYFQGGFT